MQKLLEFLFFRLSIIKCGVVQNAMNFYIYVMFMFASLIFLSFLISKLLYYAYVIQSIGDYHLVNLFE
jgi:hypothetical protein